MSKKYAFDEIVSHLKTSGYVYQGSEIYGGLSNSWDFGILGSQLKKNIRDLWWKEFIQKSPYNVGIDSAILMNPKTWEASGHLKGFSDLMVDCKECKSRFRADKMIESATGLSAEGKTPEETDAMIEENAIVCPKCGKNPCVCESSCKKKKDYSALEAELADYKAKYESLENKYNDALSSLNKYTKKEKLEIINKFSTKLEREELIEKLTAEVDNYTLDEIKNELGQALVEQLSAEEEAESNDTDSNFSLNINIADNSLGNSAWDLVKRHKANK